MGALTQLRANHPDLVPAPHQVRVLSPAQVCELWPGMTVRKLQRFRDQGTGPAYIKVGRTITYRESDLRDYWTAHRVTTREQS